MEGGGKVRDVVKGKSEPLIEKVWDDQKGTRMELVWGGGGNVAQ